MTQLSVCIHVHLNLYIQGLNTFLNLSDQNFSLVIVFSLFLILVKSHPGCSNKVCSYKKAYIHLAFA